MIGYRRQQSSDHASGRFTEPPDFRFDAAFGQYLGHASLCQPTTEQESTARKRTLDAIHRMVPAHAIELDQMPTWSAAAETMPGGAKLMVTTADPVIQTKIRGLGFFGLMATGSHHQVHHLAIALGESVHQH